MKKQSIEPSEPYATSISPSVRMKGILRSSLPLDIRGVVIGSIDAGFVRIAPGAIIETTECSVSRAVILGRFDGAMRATESITILPRANVHANIKAPSIEITESALFEGEIDVIPEKNAH